MSKLLNLFEQVISKLDTENKIEDATKKEMLASAEALINEQIAEAKSAAEVTLKEQIEKGVKEKAAEVLAAFDEYVVSENMKLFERFSKLGIENVEALTEKFEAEKANLEAEKQKIIAEQKQDIAEKLDKYLDAVVAEHLPEAKVLNEARVARLETFYNNVRELSKVSNDELQNTISAKVAEIDGEAKVLKEQLDSALKAKIELKSKIETLEKEKFLNEKTKELRPKIAEIVSESAAKLTFKEVQEKFATLVERAENIVDRRRSTIVSEQSKNVVREQVLNESKSEVDASNVMDTYVSSFSRLS